MLVKDIKIGKCYNIVTVYGAPHAKDKEAFLIELVHIFSIKNVPLIVGGTLICLER